MPEKSNRSGYFTKKERYDKTNDVLQNIILLGFGYFLPPMQRFMKVIFLFISMNLTIC